MCVSKVSVHFAPRNAVSTEADMLPKRGPCSMQPGPAVENSAGKLVHTKHFSHDAWNQTIRGSDDICCLNDLCFESIETQVGKTSLPISRFASESSNAKSIMPLQGSSSSSEVKNSWTV